MMLLFQIILICSIWTVGLTIATQPNMIFYWVRQWADKEYDKGYNYQEAIIRCVFCMPSLHSFIAYAFAFGMGLIKGFTWNIVFIWPLVVMGSSILNGIVWSLLRWINAVSEYYEEEIEIEDESDFYFDPNEDEEKTYEKMKNN